jgi:hypothetical protein
VIEMALFAHIEAGFALDPQFNQTADEYKGRFGDAVTAGWAVVVVPDGTQHGAKDNGDGTYANSPATPVVLSPRTLTRFEFLTLCQDAGGMTDENLVSAKNDALLAAFWIKLDMVSSVEKDHPATDAGLTALEGLGYLPSGKAAVFNSWPTA